MNFITRFITRHYEAHNALHNVGPVKPDVMKRFITHQTMTHMRDQLPSHPPSPMRTRPMRTRYVYKESLCRRDGKSSTQTWRKSREVGALHVEGAREDERLLQHVKGAVSHPHRLHEHRGDGIQRRRALLPVEVVALQPLAEAALQKQRETTRES